MAQSHPAKQRDVVVVAHLFSKLPKPTRQKPKAQMAVTAPKMTAPPGPLVGKLRLNLIASKPPFGGRSL